jgi:murein DD-endopeptidase MepM/ murein hydrolase activator NlpD
MRRLLSAAISAALLVQPAGTGGAGLTERGWIWPLSPVRIVAPYVQPPHEYGPGHRGIDLQASGPLRAPADGVVAFVGAVAGRGVLTIAHDGDLVSTLEPVTSELAVGTAVERGAEVAVVAAGGHAAAGTVHLGVRWRGEYVNPLLLLGGVPRAVLLPCC